MIKSTDNLNVHVSPFYFVAQCVNRPSNYSCECDSGFEGDGTLGCTGKLSIGLNLLSKLLPFIFFTFQTLMSACQRVCTLAQQMPRYENEQ